MKHILQSGSPELDSLSILFFHVTLSQLQLSKL